MKSIVLTQAYEEKGEWDKKIDNHWSNS